MQSETNDNRGPPHSQSSIIDVAKSAVDGLKGNPSCLAAIALAGIFAYLTYLSLSAERAEMHQRQMMLIQHCIAPSFPQMREKT